MIGRAPHGARGLKSLLHKLKDCMVRSRPTRGAWIEMLLATLNNGGDIVAPHTGRVD